jgi:hypothetical protein
MVPVGPEDAFATDSEPKIMPNALSQAVSLCFMSIPTNGKVISVSELKPLKAPQPIDVT